MTVLTNEYSLVEQVVTELRSVVGSGIQVFDTVPFMPSSKEFDELCVVTIESVNMAHFWAVTMGGIQPTQYATQRQREAIGLNIYGYMTASDKPGLPIAADPGASSAFLTGTATAGSTTTLTDTAQAMTVDQYANTHELWITHAATSIVEHRRILNNTATAFTVRKAFASTVAVGDTFEVWLRPTYWVFAEKCRDVMDQLTTSRSQGGRAVTGNTPGFVIEPAPPMYERSFWRATFDMGRDLDKAKSYA